MHDRRGGDEATDDEAEGLDALEERALSAWRELDPITGDEETIPEGFANRVMAADSGGRPLFAVEFSETPPLPERRRWPGLVAAAVTAGTLVAGVAWSLWPDVPAADAPAVTGDDAVQERQRASALGDPELRRDGTPGMPMPDDLAAQIDRYVATYGENWGPAFRFHGVIVVARDGDVKYSRAFGVKDPATGGLNTPRTRFRLGLLTEQFTAVAILQLRDAGILELDDPVSRFIPEFPRGNEITIEHLLRHESGLPNYTDFPYFHTWKNQPHTTEEMLARIAAEPLEFDPGTDFSPTNSGYYVLGAIVERVSGKPYGRYVEEHIFAPLDMFDSTFGDAYHTGEQARGHVWNDEEVLDPPDPIDMSVFGGAGGLVSTPLDMVKWDRALYEGSILAPASVEELMTASDSGYGYGVTVSEGYGQRVVGFPAAIDGFNGSMLRFTEDRTLVLVLCNTEVVPGGQVAHDVAMMVYGEQPPRRVEYHEVGIAPGTYRKYVGVYRLTDEARARLVKLADPAQLALLETVSVRQFGDRLYFEVPMHGQTWMHPMGHNRFFFKDHTGNTVSFALGEDNRATKLFLHYGDVSVALERAR